MQTDTILQQLDAFFRRFAVYTKVILDYFGKYVNPYLREILRIFKQISNALPDNDIAYYIILIVFIGFGVLLNYFFEKEE